MTTAAHTADVVIAGGGLIGLGIAWRARQRGLDVVLVDPTPGRGASWAAAGMLAPVTEVHYGEEDLLRLNLASAELYPRFVEELEDASGQSVGYRPCGTLAIAADAGDSAVLDDLYAFQQKLGLAVQRVGPRQARRLEPALSPAIRGGLFVEHDHQVDNRVLGAALLTACGQAGVTVIEATVTRILTAGDRVTGLQTVFGHTSSTSAAGVTEKRIEAGQTVLAAGCWSASIAGLPPHAVPPVRPVKGQIVRVQGPAEPAFLHHNVRGIVHGSQIYVVPRASGRLVIGATAEEQGFDTTVTAGAVHGLLRDAYALLPDIGELALVETLAGLRPGSPDNAPLLGAGAVDGLVIATGHYRNGVLLTPVTADTIAELLTTGEAPDLIGPFSPLRFSGVAV